MFPQLNSNHEQDHITSSFRYSRQAAVFRTREQYQLGLQSIQCKRVCWSFSKLWFRLHENNANWTSSGFNWQSYSKLRFHVHENNTGWASMEFRWSRYIKAVPAGPPRWSYSRVWSVSNSNTRLPSLREFKWLYRQTGCKNVRTKHWNTFPINMRNTMNTLNF